MSSGGTGRAAQARVALLTRLRDAGVDVDDAVEAFTGLYPSFGYGGLFTRTRVLSRRGQVLTEWAAFTGPAPTRPLRSDSVRSLYMVDSASGTWPGNRYDRVRLAGRKFWIAVPDRDIVAGWLRLRSQAVSES